ncbi:hypothetical protein OESDEN_10927 [Oesophagostomum dentatum]|uniref:Uncharacterized protein n=1 Tax=Oesophagostomum dentatum TaxID=61180 RepID=A0A0B1SVC9_OESDE|nr:hypothetical protein OESDEN_10927 [Oesophagostomum dentatum]
MRDEGASKLADDDDLYHITKKICKKANFSSSTRKSFSAKKEREIAELLRKAYWASSHTYHAGRSGEFCDTLSVESLKFVPLECDEEPDKRRKNSPKGYVCTKVEEL